MAKWQTIPEFVQGAYNAMCMRCGRKIKNYEGQKEWTGLFVCTDRCYEDRHPSDLLRSIPDKQTVPFASPEQPDNITLGSIYTGKTNGDDS